MSKYKSSVEAKITSNFLFSFCAKIYSKSKYEFKGYLSFSDYIDPKFLSKLNML